MKLHLPDSLNAKYIVAISGGPDSVALLRAMVAEHCHCIAAHCNFSLRGEESDGDEAFVRQLCRDLSVPLLTTRFDTVAYAQSKGISIEMAARELRYGWFEKIRQENDCDYIAVAHNLNDQVETFFLNLARGTGLKGLCGMEWMNGRIVRPLLDVSRDEILAYVNDYRTDSTNADVWYKRNRIRHRIIPEMQQLNPSFLKTMTKTIENLKSAQSLLEETTATATSGPSRLEQLYLQLNPLGFNRDQIHQICRAEQSEASGQLFTSPQATVVINRNQAVIYKDTKPTAQLSTVKCQLSIKENPTTLDLSYGEAKAQIAKSKVRGELLIRPIKPGDRFQPSGMHGKSKKVSDFLTALKLDVIQKQNQLVVVDKTPDGERIVWVVGWRVDERYLI